VTDARLPLSVTHEQGPFTGHLGSAALPMESCTAQGPAPSWAGLGEVRFISPNGALVTGDRAN
jgi:hypothetical protein